MPFLYALYTISAFDNDEELVTGIEQQGDSFLIKTRQINAGEYEGINGPGGTEVYVRVLHSA